MIAKFGIDFEIKSYFLKDELNPFTSINFKKEKSKKKIPMQVIIHSSNLKLGLDN